MHEERFCCERAFGGGAGVGLSSWAMGQVVVEINICTHGFCFKSAVATYARTELQTLVIVLRRLVWSTLAGYRLMSVGAQQENCRGDRQLPTRSLRLITQPCLRKQLHPVCLQSAVASFLSLSRNYPAISPAF